MQFALNCFEIARKLSKYTLLLLATISASAQTSYFPSGVLDGTAQGEKFRTEWYSKALKALDEPSLWELSKTQKIQTYRFLWLRSFHHPISVRVDIDGKGKALLTTKMMSGAGGYDPGHIIQNHTQGLTKQDEDWFLERVEQLGFWQLATYENSNEIELDGAEWIIEGVKNGKYHIVDR